MNHRLLPDTRARFRLSKLLPFKKAPPMEIGLAPHHFPPDFASVWDELCRQARPGFLKPCHRAQLEMAVLLTMDMRESGPDWPAQRYRELRNLLENLGLGGVHDRA